MEYKDLKLILDATDIKKAVDVLIGNRPPVAIADFKKQWEPAEHDILDIGKTPNKLVTYKDRETDKIQTKTVGINRIPIPAQKDIVKKAVAFLFDNDVEVSAETKDDNDILLLSALKKILDDNKADSQNRVIAKNLFRSTQVAEIWWAQTVEQHEDYGFSSKIRLRMSVFSPWNGDELFPYFDLRGDMVAFSRRFKIIDIDNKEVQHFETYTEDYYYLWNTSGSDWGLIKREPNLLKKIPVVYAEQDNTEWADVQWAIDRLEKRFSKHGDTNDYNGDPIVVMEGDMVDMPDKEDAGKAFTVEKGGKLYYLSWDHAPESVRMEIENLFKVLDRYTQTPNITLDSIKGIGAVSGITLRFLFMDAHLKVLDKREIFDPYLKRRANLLKAFIAYINSGLKTSAGRLNIKSKITPYTVPDPVERVNVLIAANGGKPIISQKAAVAEGAMTRDTDADYQQILEESKESTAGIPFEL